MESWIIQTKNALLKAEKENITSRLVQWESIVNECTKNEYTRAFKSEYTNFIHLPQYIEQITDREMNVFLHLILRWNGLQQKKVPKTLKEYLNKAKNWMNGSRAKYYSRTLYPFMIDCAEYYAQSIANILFVVDNNDVNAIYDDIESNSCYRSIQIQCNALFRDILMYSYLVQLAQCRLRVTKIGRRVHLLCDNSMIGHKTNTTAQMLQKYAQNHPYVDQFPSHRQEAIDYFNQQKHSAFNQLFVLYQKRKTIAFHKEYQLIHNTVIHSQNIVHLMGFIKNNCNSKDGKNVYIDKDTFKAISSIGVMLEHKEKENTQRINDLKQRLDELENNVEKTERKCTKMAEKFVPDALFEEPYYNNAPFEEDIEFDHGMDSYPLCPISPPVPLSCFDDIKNDYPWNEPVSSSCFEQPDSTNLLSNMFEFECNQDTIPPMPMSVDNNLLFSTRNDDGICHPFDNFSTSNVTYV